MQFLPLFVVLPLAGAFLISLIGRRVKIFSDIVTAATTFAALVISLCTIPALRDASNGMLVYKIGSWAPPIGICLAIDGLSSLLLVTVNLVSFLVAVYAVNYMEKYTAKWKFYSLFLLMVAGMNGVVATGDMFNLYVFFEIASVASYALVAYGIESEELEASFKYMVMSAVASSFILMGIAFLYSYTSTLNMADMANFLAANKSAPVITFVSVLFIMGFGLKSALVPFHSWLPDAHPSAPAPISAMLSGILIKSLGVYALCRVFFNVIGINATYLSILMFLGALSMVVGVFLAIAQWDFKRLLAYHSISQIGYVILGIGTGTPLGILGGIFHLFNHALFKSLLFLNSGSVVYATGTRDLKAMGGLSKKMPVTAATSVVASLSIAGIPPFNGFWSKLLIIVACVQSGHYVYAGWAVLVSIMTLASFMKVQRYAFFGKLSETWNNVKEAPAYMCAAMIVFAILCTVTGLLLIPVFRTVFLDASVSAVTAGTEYARLVFGMVQ